MNKILLILKREFITRVRKKTFLVMTVLGPVLMAAVFVLPAYLATLPGDERTITVLDQATLLDFDKGKDNTKFRYLPPDKFNLEEAKKFYTNSDDYAFLYIPASEGGDPDFISRNTQLFSRGDVSFMVESYIEDLLEKYIQREKLKAQGVDPEVLARTKTNVNIRIYNLEDDTETENLAPIKMGIGYVAGFLIYIFVFIYGAQVMRGVIEEKTSRIVEVMISSVKPFQLMMGKILGLASVALLQFLVWIIFGTGLYVIATTLILGDKLDAGNVAQQQLQGEESEMIFELVNTIGAINIPYILSCFIFFFLFGFLLYAALFAAVGSAVDKESDTQQFMIPLSLPIFAGLIVMIRALENPDGSIATWFSMIPLTSPIVMMSRVPFEVPWWQLVLSMVILVGTFILITWLAARIYRTGILMYGKKPSFAEIFKWITYKN